MTNQLKKIYRNADEPEWRQVVGYESLYAVNENSEIRTLHKRGRHLKISSRIDRAGYRTVRLCKGGEVRTHYVHRVVAAAFIPNPEGKPEVNHLDGNKLNNRADNLAWVTHQENIIHAHSNNLISNRTICVSCTVSGRLFRSLQEAASYWNVNYSTLRNYLSKPTSTNPTSLIKWSNDLPSKIGNEAEIHLLNDNSKVLVNKYCYLLEKRDNPMTDRPMKK